MRGLHGALLAGIMLLTAACAPDEAEPLVSPDPQSNSESHASPAPEPPGGGIALPMHITPQWKLVRVVDPTTIEVAPSYGPGDTVFVRLAFVRQQDAELTPEISKDVIERLVGPKKLYLQADPNLPDKDADGRLLRYVWTVARCVTPNGGDRVDDLLNLKVMIYNGADYDESRGRSTYYHEALTVKLAPVR